MSLMLKEGPIPTTPKVPVKGFYTAHRVLPDEDSMTRVVIPRTTHHDDCCQSKKATKKRMMDTWFIHYRVAVDSSFCSTSPQVEAMVESELEWQKNLLNDQTPNLGLLKLILAECCRANPDVKDGTDCYRIDQRIDVVDELALLEWSHVVCVSVGENRSLRFFQQDSAYCVLNL